MVTLSLFAIIRTAAAPGPVLTTRVGVARTAHCDRLRTLIILTTAGGAINAVIAANLGVYVDTVRNWRRRYVSDGLAWLVAQARSGIHRASPRSTSLRSRRWPASPPAERDVPLARSNESSCNRSRFRYGDR